MMKRAALTSMGPLNRNRAASVWARLRYLNSRENVERHPVAAAVATFVPGTATSMAYALVRYEDPSALRVLVFGVVGGLVLSLALYRAASSSARRGRINLFETVLLLVGGGIFLVGLLASSVAVALSGIPFIALALVLVLIGSRQEGTR